MPHTNNHKCEEDHLKGDGICYLCGENSNTSKKPKISSKLEVCPKCKKKQFVVSIFGSICGNCFYTEYEGVLKGETLEEMRVCGECGKKLKQCWKYDIPNKKRQKETGCFYCPCNPKMFLSIG